MILNHYKLAMQPFGVTPDPRFLYLSPTHREALASLLHGINSGRGFSALIATPGMGKTTLLFNLLQMLKGLAKTAFLFQTLCEPREFLASLLSDLGIEDDGKVIMSMQAKLNEFLLRESLNGRQVVVVIDEAQNLDEQVLEIVRMLSNFETPKKKLMHVILAGQPQLADKLASEGLTQLRQRISIVARLAPFDADETRAYIDHRLRVAGHGDEPLFTNRAYAKIAQQSGGIPRNINNLCFNGMSLACALKRSKVDESIIAETIDDLDLTTIGQRMETKTAEPADQRSGSSHREMRGFSKWRPSLFSAAALLLIFLWPIFQTAKPSQQSPRAAAMPASTEAAVEGRTEKTIPHPPQRTKHRPLPSSRQDKRKYCDNCNAGPEHNVVPFESAAQREKP